MSTSSKKPGKPAVSGEVLPPIPPAKVRLYTLDDVRLELGRVYRDTRGGNLDPADATKLAYILGQIARIFQAVELERRIAALEAGADGPELSDPDPDCP